MHFTLQTALAILSTFLCDHKCTVFLKTLTDKSVAMNYTISQNPTKTQLSWSTNREMLPLKAAPPPSLSQCCLLCVQIMSLFPIEMTFSERNSKNEGSNNSGWTDIDLTVGYFSVGL